MIKIIKDSILTIAVVSAALFYEPLSSLIWVKVSAIVLVGMLCIFALLSQKLIDSLKELLKANNIEFNASKIVDTWLSKKEK